MEPSAPPAGDPSLPPAHATFDTEWNFQSPARLFANLPPKPRAWERLPRQRQPLSTASANAGKKSRTIWKRHDGRPQPAQQHYEHSKTQQHPLPVKTTPPEHDTKAHPADDVPTPDGKVVKRVRLGIDSGVVAGEKKRSAAAWDRRRSALPHKTPALGQLQPNNESTTFADPIYEQLSVEDSSESRPVQLGNAVTPSDPPQDFDTGLHLATPSEDHIDRLQSPSSVAFAASTTIAFQPDSQAVEQSNNPASNESLVQLVEAQHQEQDVTAPGPSEKQAAGAQHLEEMRRKLSSRLSRVGRRKTEIVKPTLHTPPRQRHRRVSAALDSLRADTIDFTSNDSAEDALILDKANHGSSPVNQPVLAVAETNKPSSLADDATGQDSLNVDVSMLDVEQSSATAPDASYSSIAGAPLSPVASVAVFADLSTADVDEVQDVERIFITQDDASMDFEVEAIFQEVIEATVEAVTEDQAASDNAESLNVGKELAGGLSISKDTSPCSDEQAAPEKSTIEEVVAETPVPGIDDAPSADLCKVHTISTKQVTEALEACQTEEPPAVPDAEVAAEAQETLETIDPAKAEMLGAPELEQDESNKIASTVKVSLNDDDTDILKDFLSRAKASKAAKIANQSSLLNRRDSDVVKHALASPRRVLDDLDANSPSPRKSREGTSIEGTVSIAEEDHFHGDTQSSPTRNIDGQNDDDLGGIDELAEIQPMTRRSTRGAGLSNTSVKRSSASAITTTPSTISVRRQDGSEQVVLRKSEAHELAILTRTNTRRNKGGAIPARATLMKLKGISIDDSVVADDSLATEGRVRWNEELVAYFEEGKDDQLQQLGDEKSAGVAVSKPRARRAKMLGAMNGTPAKVRTKGGDSIALLEENTMELPSPAFTAYKETLEASADIEKQTQPQNDDHPAVVPTSKDTQDAPKQATRTLRRIPTPAKPPKSEATEAEPMMTRHNSAPGQVRKRNGIGKENNGGSEARSSKDRSQAKGVAQTRSGASAGGAAAEAAKRSMVPRRGAKK